MKLLIVYKSVHRGNTKKIAEELARKLSADIKDADEVIADMLQDYDLIGFGSGIYFGKHHKNIFNLLSKIPSLNRKVFIFSTRGRGPAFLYHRQLRETLKEWGCSVVGEFSCKGFSDYGILKYIGGINNNRPNKRDFDKVGPFTERVFYRLG